MGHGHCIVCNKKDMYVFNVVVVDSAYIYRKKPDTLYVLPEYYSRYSSDGDLFLLLRFSIYMCIKLCEFYVPKINL